MSPNPSKILFLTIDGVLHPKTSGDTPANDARLFEHAQALAESLEGTQVKIVLTSSWRPTYSISQIRTLAPALAPRIIGVAEELNSQPRYVEIQDWLEKHPRHNVDWLVLDDDASHYPPGCTQLVACDSELGLGAKELMAVSQWARPVKADA